MEKSPRNSPLRNLSRPLVRVAEYVHEKMPGVHPDHITYAGLLGTSLGTAFLVGSSQASPEYQSAMQAAGILMIAGGTMCDGIDGALARIKKAADGGFNTDRGQLVDVVSDRIAEHASSLGRVAIAYLAGNEYAQNMALLAGATNYIPSMLRARAEAKGIVVSESGSSPIEFAGTRAGRFMANTAAIAVGAMGYPSIQGAIDTVAVTGNLASSARRWHALHQEPQEDADTDPTLQAQAEIRHDALLKTSAAGIAAQVGIGVLLNS